MASPAVLLLIGVSMIWLSVDAAISSKPEPTAPTAEAETFPGVTRVGAARAA